MPRPPSVSVVVPAYNHERFVGEALASVLAQTFQDFDVVVVDDGSTDGTAAVVQALAASEPRIRLVRQANGGSHAAINRGIAESDSRWIAVLNSDDRFAPTRLARLHAEGEAGARFAVTDVQLIDGDGAQITNPDHWWHRTQRDFRDKAARLGPVQGLLYGNYTVSTSNFFFERELAREIGPVRARRFIPDWDWALRAALHAPDRFRHLAGEKLLDYRLHGDNAILHDGLAGDCEISHLHRELLVRTGAPAPLVSAVFRNQRDLRRLWRTRGVAPVEQFVRDREADVDLLRAGVATRDAGIGTLQIALETRDADVATLQAEAVLLRGQITAQQELIAGQHEQIASEQKQIASVNAYARECEALIREAESSIVWRVVRRLRRAAGIGPRP